MSADVANDCRPVGTGTPGDGDEGPRRYAGVIAAVLLLSLLLISVWTFSIHEPSAVRAVESGSDRFPSETFTDWVSYADHVVVFSVVDERARPEQEFEPGSRVVGREVTLRIEGTLWSREGAPSIEQQVKVVTWGWLVEEEKREPMAARGGPRPDIGSRYVAPLVRAPRDGVDRTPLSDGATLPLDDGLITTEGIVGSPSPIARHMQGSTPAELAEAVARTAPDPVAVQYRNLPPDQRWQAVRQESGGN